jgi:Mn2+/Fe2+ NRAMP family transporter
MESLSKQSKASHKRQPSGSPFSRGLGGVSGPILGAAFLMATSAIGPGFLTQTTVFTQQLLASFGFVILISILLDIGAQLNIWRTLTMREMRAQDLANQFLPGLGYLLAFMIVAGGIVFNIGNIAGCGLGLNVLTGLKTEYAAIISCMIALFIFWMKEAGKMLDAFTKILGLIMIVLTLYIAISSQPPIADAFKRTFIPETINSISIITLVGGTVGGYISFAGAHRLLDAGIKGRAHLKDVNRSAVSGIVITGIMRTVLFLAVLGVVTHGGVLSKDNPAASVFQLAAGDVGYKFFGVVMWSAAITSVVGASYTSVSFIKTFHPWLYKNEKWLITIFIIVSTVIFIGIGKPISLLLFAGAVNGFILPFALAIILLVSQKKNTSTDFRNPTWLIVTGWIVVAVLLWMAVKSLLT